MKRLEIAQQHLDPRIIEAEIDCGQIEELILQAEDVCVHLPYEFICVPLLLPYIYINLVNSSLKNQMVELFLYIYSYKYIHKCYRS